MYNEFSEVYDHMMEYADYDEIIKYLIDKIKEQGIKEGKLLDLGCGSGEILKKIPKEYEVSGMDLSGEMLEIARTKIDSKIKLYHDDMRTFKTGEKYSSIISIFDTINHLTSNFELEMTLKNVNEHLEEGGIYIFDVVSREFMEEMFPGGSFIDEREKMMVVWEHEYEEETGLDYVYVNFFIEDEDGRYRRIYEEHSKKIFSKEELELAIKNSGFEILEIDENDEFAGVRDFYTLKKIWKKEEKLVWIKKG